MKILTKSIFVERFETKNPVNENNAPSVENDQNQVTPQNVIDSLPSYTIRLKEPYLHPENSCAFCYRTYSVGDKVTCLPCQHHFHNHCIENWLKWVKPTCPEDKKSVIRKQYGEECIKESQNRMLDEKAVEDAQCSSKHGKEIFRNGELESNSAENPRKKQEAHTLQTAESPTKLVPDFSSIVSVVGYGRKKHRGSEREQSSALHESPSKVGEENGANEWHNPCTINDKEQDAMFIMSPDKRKRMQESIDAIRRSIKPRVLTAKKLSGNPEEFQDALKMAVAKLSKTIICSPSKSKSKDIKCPYEASSKAQSSSINKESERYTSLGHIIGNAGTALGYNTGWIYKRATFD